MHTTAIYLLGAFAIIFTGCSARGPIVNVPHHEVEIVNLGPSVNSPVNDFSPTITANGASLYFTSGRGAAQGQSYFWLSQHERGFWAPPMRLGPPLLDGEHNGTLSISADGQTLYFASMRENSIGGVDIYSATLDGDIWGNVMNLGTGVNSDGWESQPSISPDGNALYFVSDRSGGFGGLDIWMSVKDAEGNWLPATNLGPAINTKWNEVTPFIAADNMTLYFASNGHPGMKGTDLFVSRRIQGEWSKPENMGSPLNSDENDEFLTLTAEGTVIYYSSQRAGGNGGLDLYRAEPNPFPPQAVLVLSGTVRDGNSRAPLGAQLNVVDGSTGQRLSSHTSNDLTGEYLVVLPAGKEYFLVATEPEYRDDSLHLDLSGLKIYSERSEDILLSKAQQASGIEAHVSTNVPATAFTLLEGGQQHAGLLIEEIEAGETAPLLPYIFFDALDAALDSRYARLTVEEAAVFDPNQLPEGIMSKYRHILNIAGFRMIRYPDATLTVTGTLADSEAISAGLGLAEQRADAVRDYLTAVWNIASARIRTDALRQPRNPSAGSTEEGMNENRRVELTSSDDRVLAPIVNRSVARIISPEEAVFYPRVLANSSVQSWTFTVAQGGATVFEQSGSSVVPDSIAWDWKDGDDRLPDASAPLAFHLSAIDVTGERAKSPVHTIPVTVSTLRKKATENLPDRTIERIHLILFDFDKSALSNRHDAMLEALDPIIKPQSTVAILGYTDIIGESDYNLKLSQERAGRVHSALRKRHPGIPMLTEGLGESAPLFDQQLPEGRFYSRTVVVTIETRKQ